MPFDEIKNITAEPNEMWAMWKKLFLHVLNKHAPLAKIKVKGNNLPYTDSETRRFRICDLQKDLIDKSF